MSDILQLRRIQIGLRELVVIDDARGQVLTCESGELWLTQDGDSRDVILPAGQSWRVDRSGPLVLSAFQPAVATLDRINRWRFPALASFPATCIV
ncbi:MAG: DUF2917 domain-containing protein [Rhodocyclales bacterium]|nr:DUF2917 domain-containing protein [Rhodocyclales bacterium]